MTIGTISPRVMVGGIIKISVDLIALKTAAA
jgi:hypothetical protein